MLDSMITQKMKFLTAIAAVLALVIYFSISYSNSLHRKTIGKMISQGALIVDVRTPAEFSSGHFNGAINIPLGDIEKKLSLLDVKYDPIIVYCRTGNRSSKAKRILERHGFTRVVNGGGLNDMQK